jgi:predicted GNAT family acetyltransferase
MTNDSPAAVLHEPANNRFALYLEGETSVLDYYLSNDTVVFTHTGVPAALEGGGIGSKLVQAGLDWAREQGLRISSRCWFVSKYIDRHPEYRDLT